jgi:tetratricopeptide (TPR) repeat protein
MKSTISLGYSMDRNARDRANLGLEFYLNSLIILRAGYEYYVGGDDSVPGVTGIVAGFGFYFDPVRLDYAYIPLGVLGNAHRVSLVYHFDTGRAAAVAAAKTAPAHPRAPDRQLAAAAETLPATLPPPAPFALPGQVQALPSPTPQLKFRLEPAQEKLRLARELGLQKKHRQAMKVYNEVLHEDSNNSSAWRGLGRLYFDLGKKEFAVQCYKEVLRLEPQDQSLREWLQNYTK